MQFTYTNDEDIVDDKDTVTTADDETTKNNNMAGGQVRLEIPRDWSVTKNWIKVVAGHDDEDAEVIYESDGEGFPVTELEIDDVPRVKVSASRRGNVSSVTVNLDDSWSEDDESLVITFGEVTVPGESGSYEFTTESKGSDKGNLVTLSGAYDHDDNEYY